MPCSVSVVPLPWSPAMIVRLVALMMPCATVGLPPCPPALPMARTGVPSETWAELPTETVFRPEAFCNWSSATSSVAS